MQDPLHQLLARLLVFFREVLDFFEVAGPLRERVSACVVPAGFSVFLLVSSGYEPSPVLLTAPIDC